LAAGLAFHLLFSLAPLLFLGVALAGLVFEEEAALGLVADRLGATLGEEVATMVEGWVLSAATGGGTAVWIGLSLAVVTGSGVFLNLQGALDLIFGVPATRTGGIVGFVLMRSRAFLAALAFGLALVTLLVAQAALQYLSEGIVPLVGRLAALLVLVAVVAAMFKFLTAGRVAWRPVVVGAAFTAIAGTLASYLVGLYVGQVSNRGVFAAVGSVAVLLYFTYLMAQVLLLGAELTKEVASEDRAT
jgi:membrane protein